MYTHRFFCVFVFRQIFSVISWLLSQSIFCFDDVLFSFRTFEWSNCMCFFADCTTLSIQLLFVFAIFWFMFIFAEFAFLIFFAEVTDMIVSLTLEAVFNLAREFIIFHCFIIIFMQYVLVYQMIHLHFIIKFKQQREVIFSSFLSDHSFSSQNVYVQVKSFVIFFYFFVFILQKFHCIYFDVVSYYFEHLSFEFRLFAYVLNSLLIVF